MTRSLTNTPPARNVRADAFVAQMHRTDRAAVVRAIEQRDVAELERAAIARRIKQARKEAGLSQPEMADALGVIQRTYQNYESLKEPRTPWPLMNQIATVTGKTTEWLIHGDTHAATPAMNGDSTDRLARIEKRLDQLEIAVDHQNQNLATQSQILVRLEQLVRVLIGQDEAAGHPLRTVAQVAEILEAARHPAQTTPRDAETRSTGGQADSQAS